MHASLAYTLVPCSQEATSTSSVCPFPACACCFAAAAGIYTHTPEQLEEAGKYLEEKRAALKGVKIVTELEPINMYYKAEVRMLLVPQHMGLDTPTAAQPHYRLPCALVLSALEWSGPRATAATHTPCANIPYRPMHTAHVCDCTCCGSSPLVHPGACNALTYQT